MEIKTVKSAPTAIEYCQIRQKCGLTLRSMGSAEKALRNSLYAVKILDGDQVVGMGRVVGDSGSFAQVVDIAVLPDYQGRGFSRIIMQSILDYISLSLPIDCHVSLLSDVDFLYQKFGFEVSARSQAMVLKRR